MAKEMKLVFKSLNEKGEYQDLVYELKKHYRSKRIPEIIVSALESELRRLNCEICEEE